MNEELKAFLRIEKLSKGKIESYEEWDEIPLNTDMVMIGRYTTKVDAIVPDIKILGDDYISRNQCEIYFSFTEGSFMICDVESLNGTYINGELLEKNRHYTLKDHDLIGLAKISGDMRVVFRFRASEATLPPWVEAEPQKHLSKEGFMINMPSRRAFVDGKEIPLTGKEFKVLEVLYNNRGNACSKDDIAWEVWGEEGASDELVAKYISRLRGKIEPNPLEPRFIITVPRGHRCYRLDM